MCGNKANGGVGETRRQAFIHMFWSQDLIQEHSAIYYSSSWFAQVLVDVKRELFAENIACSAYLSPANKNRHSIKNIYVYNLIRQQHMLK